MEDRSSKIEMPWFRKMNENSLTESPELHLEEIIKTYSLKQNLKIKKPCLECDLRIIVTGKTGVGKSATANTILGEELFPENVSLEVSSLVSESHNEKIDGRNITVMETPCLSNLEGLKEHLRRRITERMVEFAKSSHAFVYVFNMASPRFTREDKVALAAIESLFESDRMKDKRLLVYTHAESCLSSDMDLDQFYQRQTGKNTEVGKFLKELKGNIVAINNKSEIPEEAARNQNVIIGMVDKVVRESEQSMCSNMALKTRESLIERRLLTFTDKNHNLLIRDTIEMILGNSPNLSGGKLVLKVKRQLEEDLQRHEKMVSTITLQNIEEEYLEMQNKGCFTTRDGNVNVGENAKARAFSFGRNTELEMTVMHDTRTKTKSVCEVPRKVPFQSTAKLRGNANEKKCIIRSFNEAPKSTRNVSCAKHQSEPFSQPFRLDDDDTTATARRRTAEMAEALSAKDELQPESVIIPESPPKAKNETKVITFTKLQKSFPLVKSSRGLLPSFYRHRFNTFVPLNRPGIQPTMSRKKRRLISHEPLPGSELASNADWIFNQP